uniref:UDP-glucose:glycoprotein glucosyltransferase n=1 Tax=Panagrolaimus superbus TaxID=310955 RepID=A0A914YQY2_9BILA
MKLRALLLAFLTFNSLGSIYAASSKSVITSLDSQWHHTSFLAETGEFIATESNQDFWKFVDEVVSQVPASKWSNRTQENEYEISVQQAVKIISAARADLLKLALSMRLYSPKVLVFQQLTESFDKNIQSCKAFVDISGIQTCAPDEIESKLKATTPKSFDEYSIDHVYPLPLGVDEDNLPVVILYGELGTDEFAKFHQILKALAKKGEIKYLLRHFSSDVSNIKVGLSGYGVELAIKNTEYKAVDDSNQKQEDIEDSEEENDIHGFNFNTLRKNNPHLKDAFKQFKVHLTELDELTPLKQWEVSDISYQAAQKVIDSSPEEALNTLVDLSQNFPIRARSLVQTRVKQEFRDEIESNQQIFKQEYQIVEGENALYVNGINLDVDSLDIFQLFDTVNQEEKISSAFFEMGFRREYLYLLFNVGLSEEKGTNYAIDFREAYPEYINNLDKDKAYKQWGNSVKLMLQPYFPGMIRPIARNFFTIIVIVDPAAPESLNIIKTAHALYSHQVPVRIGFIFIVNDDKSVSGKDDVGVALLNLYNFAKTDKTPAKAINLMTKCIETYNGRPTVVDVHQFFKKYFSDQEVDDVFAADSDYDTGRSQGKAFLERSGIGSAPKVLVNGVVIEDSDLGPDKLEEAISMKVMKQTSNIQRAVMTGKLNDKENVQNWILSQADVLPRLNARLLDEPTDYLPVNDVFPCETTNPSKFASLIASKKTSCMIEKAKYLTRNEEEKTYSFTIWVVADFDTVEGRQLLNHALKHLKKSNNARITILQNGEAKSASTKSASKLIHAIWRLLPNNIAKQMLTKLLQKESILTKVLETNDFEDVAVHGMNMDSFKKELKQLSDEHLQLEGQYAHKVLNLKPGDRALIFNGQVYGPLNTDEKFESDDFGLAEKIAEKKGAKAVAEQVEAWDVEKAGGKSSDVVLRSIAVIGKYATKKARTWINLHGDSESVVTLAAEDNKRAILDVVAIIDPLTKQAQKMAPLLQLFSKVINCDMKIVMNPKNKLSELPLKRFYRYVVKEEPAFDANGAILSPTTSFTELPSKQLLTLNVISPDSWMIQPIFAGYDLDNIKMQTVKNDVVAKFELIHILLEGHCFDDLSGSPPRGLQFLLGTESDPSRYDTIVMANLGYFQLKASPGAWVLHLREGRSKELYDIANHTNTEKSDEKNENVRVLIDSFLGRTLRVMVTKKPGKEQESLLADSGGDETQGGGGGEEEGGSLWSSLSNVVGGGEKYDTINIFSLASGHLYERFLRIMMLSVIKNTKHPVKFWLLNNYLSPQFRETLPKLANEYKFDYELVEYKWPRWLHQQSEKQRIMWGYKILFLDVLFPLNVRKIIFVDADQIIRTDMMELMNFDLDGAPYGFTPFCDSRTSMEGFRFWKQGYWAQHLAGRRYHISALYVIDLAKFRQIAAGDRLRGQYQGLSADPNSLSNLDQDLPNNMIHQVRIKSLPQEWLWCETWCSDSSKESAKTIDLCNNPQTKEPKLDSAVRIIPEWKEYDEEIKRVLSDKTSQKDDANFMKKDDDDHTEL